MVICLREINLKPENFAGGACKPNSVDDSEQDGEEAAVEEAGDDADEIADDSVIFLGWNCKSLKYILCVEQCLSVWLPKIILTKFTYESISVDIGK